MPHLRPVALLVLLAAAAGTWVVTAHLLPGDHRLGPAAIVAAAELHGLQLFVLLALNIAREVFHAALGGLALRFSGGLCGRRLRPRGPVGRWLRARESV